MQWSKEGTHVLLQTRVRTLNGELGAIFKRWYPDMDLEGEEMPGAASSSASPYSRVLTGGAKSTTLMGRLTYPPWTMSPSQARLSCAQPCRFQLCCNEVQTVFQVGHLPIESAQRFLHLLHSIFVAFLEDLEWSCCTHGDPSGSLSAPPL